MRSSQYFAMLALIASACGDDGATSSSSGGGAAACTPGEQVACACPGGASGTQVCNAEGTALLACSCGGATTTTTSATTSNTSGGETTSTSDGGGTTTGADGGGGAGSSQGGSGASSGAGGGGATGTGGDGGSGGGTTGSGGEDPAATSWLLGFGDVAYEQQLVGVFPREDGGLIATMRGRGTFDIGAETYSSPNDINPVVVSIAADGSVEGFLGLEGAGEWPFVSAVFPSDDGALALVGSFCAPVDFGEGLVFNDGCDAFIARYDATGDLVRVKILNGLNSQSINTAVEVDGDIVILVGSSQSPIDLGGELVDSESRFVLARLDGEDDSVVWARGFDAQVDGGSITPDTLHFDGANRVVMAGRASNGGSDFGDGYQLGTNENGYFVATFDVDGVPSGSRSGPCAGGVYVTDLDTDGNLAFVGYAANTSPCDIEGAPAGPIGRAFVGRFDADFAESALDPVDGCHLVPFLDGEGLLVAASCIGEVDFGDGPTEPNGDDQDFVIVRYDARGEVMFVERYGPEGAYAERAVRGANGELFLGATTCLDIDLGFGAYEHQGACDAWVARIDDP